MKIGAPAKGRAGCGSTRTAGDGGPALLRTEWWAEEGGHKGRPYEKRGRDDGVAEGWVARDGNGAPGVLGGAGSRLGTPG